MRELAQLVVSEFHFRALFVGLGILLGFNYGIQYKPSVVSFIATIGSSGATFSLPAAPSNPILPIQVDFFFPSRSVSVSFPTIPTSTTILPSLTTSTHHWLIPSQANWNPHTDPNGISGLSELSSVPVSKSSFSKPGCNSTLGSSKGQQFCRSSHQEAIKPYFEALTRVFVARRSLQNAPRPNEEVRKEGFTDLILHPSYTTSTSQEKFTGIPDWNTQTTSEFGWGEILVLPALLAIVIKLTVYIAFVIVSTVLDLVIGSVALCAYSTRVCRAVLVFLSFPQAAPLELNRRQRRLRARHRKKGDSPNTTSDSLRPPVAIRTFLYAPEQCVRLEHVILRDENTSMSIPSSKDLYDPRYLVIVKTLGKSGSGRVSIVKNFKKQDETDAEQGQLVLKTVSRYHGGYRLLQFAQELRALDRLQESRWCSKLVASFAGPEDLHMLMTYFPRGHLADFIREAGGHLSRAQAKFYLVELFIAVRAIHKMGVFHRGIALENLFLTGSGHLTISDFRKAKINYDANHPTENEVAVSEDGFRDYYAMIKVYYKMVTGNSLSTIYSKRPVYKITKEDNSFFKLLLKPFSENRKLPSPMDMQKHAIFDRINWDAMEKQLVAVPASSRQLGKSLPSHRHNA